MTIAVCVSCQQSRKCGLFIRSSGTKERVCGECWDEWEKKYGMFPVRKSGMSAGGGTRVIRNPSPLT